MKSLDTAYRRLDYVEYTNVIKDTLVPLFDDYDGEFLTMVGKDTVFVIKEHWYKKIKMGYNILADDVLIETRETLQKARKFLKKLIKSINQEI